MFDWKNGFSLTFIALLSTFAVGGLFFCWVMHNLVAEGPVARVFIGLMFFFLAVLFGMNFILVPIQILYFNRKNRDDSKLKKATLADWLMLPFGACDADAKVSRWVSVPLLVVLWVLVAIFVVAVIGSVTAWVVGPTAGG
ncbi:hypothetical protein STSP2_01305 [Anaerohalosphaera lusitana]|uniref:Uncharacterized protein n=1 Tax=Anaerohalosphaera lusitana TaxID=1936003 RepID=A0A1U9NKN3_9BACT|nr:hypothetical protein [Anaerohalosphaera lusitana]AQT68150.1 hypothetical protein STSP2_01305 [Anaerohalosphaera lusitana]